MNAQLAIDFDPPRLDRPQGLMQSARKRGQRLGDLAADRAAEDFRERAKAFAVRYLQVHGPSSSEVITDAAKAAGITPPDDRAFGPVYAALAKKGQIEFAGWCARVKGHGTAGGRLWRVAA
jgi:hypothetical protein